MGKRTLKKGRAFTAVALTIAIATTGIISIKRNKDNSSRSNYVIADEVETMTTSPIVSAEVAKNETETETKQIRCAEDYNAYKIKQAETNEKYLLKVSTDSVNLYDSYGNISAYPQKGDFLLTDGIAYEKLMRVSWRNNDGNFVIGWADFNRDPEAPLTETKGYYELVK